MFALSFALCAVAPHAMTLTEESSKRGVPSSDNRAPCHGHPDGGEDDSPPPAGRDAPSFDCCGVGTPASVPTFKGQDLVAVLVTFVPPAISSTAPAPFSDIAVHPPAPPGRLHLLHGCFLT
jgi:hypothetical protein